MKKAFNFAALLSVMLAALTVGASLAMEKDKAGAEPQISGNLAVFLTQIDSMVAGRALPFAAPAVREGRPSRVIPAGGAGRLGLSDH